MRIKNQQVALTRMKLLVPIVFSCLIYSCSNGPKRGDQNISANYPNMPIKRVSELTEEQDSALDALTTIQVSTDTKNRLYTTFANIYRPCYPADTSVIMTQSEMLKVMTIFVSDHCKSFTVEQQQELANISVRAQAEYQVLHCSGNPGNKNYDNGIPMTGKWIIPNILGRIDLVLEWPD